MPERRMSLKPSVICYAEDCVQHGRVPMIVAIVRSAEAEINSPVAAIQAGNSVEVDRIDRRGPKRNVLKAAHGFVEALVAEIKLVRSASVRVLNTDLLVAIRDQAIQRGGDVACLEDSLATHTGRDLGELPCAGQVLSLARAAVDGFKLV